MGFLAGFVGALVGAVTGIVGAFLLVSEMSDGNDIGDGFALMGAAPIGLLLGIAVGIPSALSVLGYLRRTDLGASARRKKTLAAVSCVACPVSLIGGMGWLQQECRKPPSDVELIANFQRHQSAFDQLADMAQSDNGLRRVGSDWTDPENAQSIGVSTARISQYRKLFDAAHVPGGFEAFYPSEGIQFPYWGHGSAVSSDVDKGYAYLATPPAKVFGSLDGCEPDRKNGSVYYRHIVGNWYLYYDYLPG